MRTTLKCSLLLSSSQKGYYYRMTYVVCVPRSTVARVRCYLEYSRAEVYTRARARVLCADRIFTYIQPH